MIENTTKEKIFCFPTLSILLTEFFEEIYKDRNNYIVLNIDMIIDNILKFQNKDGSFDEWYRFERSFVQHLIHLSY